MQNGEQAGMLLEAGAAAEQLGVSPSGMRRLAVIYEQVHGPLLRRGGGGRLFSSEALEALETARRVVELEQVATIREALQRLKEGERLEMTLEAVEGAPVNAQVLSGAVVRELRALRAEVEALRSEVATRGLPEGQTGGAGAGWPDAPGPFVRFAVWLERRLRGGRG